ncbi:GNAT family N-acetyltransferase [Paenibacillus apiarius]|uniref:GNAT family N-acetyltransferase n=1 Tax=Paenibacillus apiarius TaxID=46240 RepID=A0ABT4DSU8_9BACL|nr:GNAT family N-acetyltransferase [Paenibacillus apiarius]MCY9512765.1 GNAT family N-acetyltransferase [Paenibacillus apiarius]MCY9519091.1 GNAT family N-acetyltransferase [Paenibacillus apiarius]MCY9554715.1 GNAT family N-acetyltransferase [Paenibacillus apiarius]MCY9559666.1 GNAT family N-acetyltransferase [Paenibacillus apiarius]MCY9681909.1 GNAT family N-acetyltransferase [Paenibacillus apiarius]
MMMIKLLDMNDDETLEQLWYLQRLAYRIEADILGFERIPPLMDTIADLRQTSETFYGWWADVELVGALSYEMAAPAIMDICRLMVRPDHFRQGIGTELLKHALQLPQASTYWIATGVRNVAALKLYEREGFRAVRDEEIVSGVWLRHLEMVKPL